MKNLRAKITGRYELHKLMLFFMGLYMVSYITRINYGAVISEMTASENIQKSAASLALTASAVTYGFGQLISGYLSDRFRPKLLILAGLFTTAFANIIVPFCTRPEQTALVWGINGLAQAFMWPPLVKIMAAVFSANDYKRACVIVTWGSSVGTVLVYVLSPILIFAAGWRSIFAASALCAIVTAVLWCKRRDIDITPEKTTGTDETVKNKAGAKYVVLMLSIMLAIVFQGVLRDGVTTWTPSYLADIFGLDNKLAILTGVIIPLFSIAAIQLTSVIYRRFFENELALIAILFGVGVISSLALLMLSGINVILSAVFLALLVGCMYGANLIMTCMLPAYFARSGNISFVSGLLNFCTYIGSAASGAGMALFSENYGWNGTLVLWAAVACVGGVICLCLSGLWSGFKKSEI